MKHLKWIHYLYWISLLFVPDLSWSQQDNSMVTKNTNMLNINLGSPSTLSIIDKYSNQIQIRVSPSQEFEDKVQALSSCSMAMLGAIEFLNQLEPVLSAGSWARDPLTNSRAAMEASKLLVDKAIAQ